MTKDSISPELRRQAEAHDAPGNQMIKEARALLRAGKLQEAEQKCRQAMEYFRDNELSIPYELLGDILLAKGEYQKALDEYAVFSRSGWSTTLHINIALCYLRLGDLDKAKEAYLDEIQTERGLRPEHMPGTEDLKSMELTLMLALSGVHSGDSPEALKYLLAAEKLAPENWEIVDAIGQRLDYMERYDDAIPYYKRAIKLGGDKVPYEHQVRVEMYDMQHGHPHPPHRF